MAGLIEWRPSPPPIGCVRLMHLFIQIHDALALITDFWLSCHNAISKECHWNSVNVRLSSCHTFLDSRSGGACCLFQLGHCQSIFGINTPNISPLPPWQDDEVVLQSVAIIQKEHHKFCLAAEGLGNRLCYLEPTSEAKVRMEYSFI